MNAFVVVNCVIFSPEIFGKFTDSLPEKQKTKYKLKTKRDTCDLMTLSLALLLCLS